MSTVRTRMAPSPTGEYHIGHIRTVLYNYAFAKKHGGEFIIRIEDTDRERFVEGAAERILGVIDRYGLSWDEGPDKGGDHGPYVQSERLEIYKEHAEKLLDSGHAYRCFCTKEDLEEMRAEQRNKGLPKTMYDGRCRKLTTEKIVENINNDIPYVVRLKVPKDEAVIFDDEVYGRLEFDTSEIDDTVLLKSDGYPTYHLAVVVDDHLMEISHIMRGNDWLPSAPKHVLLYKAFGWKIPTHIHLPNLKELGANKKLSKRFGSVYAEEFLREGYLVEALLNFLMFLGWNPGDEKEIYSLEEFIEDFDVKRIHKTDLVAFDRDKLVWLNGYYIRNMPNKKLCRRIRKWATEFGKELKCGDHPKEHHFKILGLVKERMKVLSEYEKLTYYFYHDPKINKNTLTKYAKPDDRAKEIIEGFYKLFENLSSDKWNISDLEEVSYSFVKENNYKNKEAFMTLRVAVTGEVATPPVFDILEVLGKETVLKRLEAAAQL